MTESKSMSSRHAEKYLRAFGFDTKVTPSMQKYLLEMPNAGSDAMISSSLVSRFNDIINKHGTVMSGGRVSFPAEYFGAPANASYVSNPSFAQTGGPPLPTGVARVGLPHTTLGGGVGVSPSASSSSGLLKYNQFGGFAAAYEKKFLRRLSIKPAQKKYVMDELNKVIHTSLRSAIRSNKAGRLTKTAFEKKLKGI